MDIKYNVAKKMSKIGIETIIANGKEENILEKIFSSKKIGTRFLADKKVSAIKKWIAVSENIARYIERTRPERKAQYDIFSSSFKNKREVDDDINHIREMQTEWQSSRKKRGGKSTNKTRKSGKYIKS